MTAIILGEHYSISDFLEHIVVWCTGCHHKIPILKLRVKITDNQHAIVCPMCGDTQKTLKGNKKRNAEEHELHKCIMSLVNEQRFKLYHERIGLKLAMQGSRGQ